MFYLGLTGYWKGHNWPDRSFTSYKSNMLECETHCNFFEAIFRHGGEGVICKNTPE